jgi:hypothetical protein
MTGTDSRWTADQVLALAPDDASRTAGARAGTRAPWSGTGASREAVWGVCAGSGSRPYQTAVDLRGPAFACSCPSRKSPCKHALGLLLLWAAGEGGGVAEGAAAPEWAEQWLAVRRKERERQGGGRDGEGEREGPDGQDGPGGGGGPAEAARKRAERRAVRVEGGAAELEQRLTDLLRSGLAGAEGAGGAREWEEIAARMVDAQAPGLAARVRALGAVPGAGGDWPSRMLEEAGLLHLLARGYLGRQRLPAGLAATVRTRIGFTVDSAEVLAGPRVRGSWLVLAQYDTAEERLTTRRIWLYEEGSARFALVLSYGAAGRAPELALPVGSVLDAEVAFHPAAVPLRAALGTVFATKAPSGVPPGTSVEAALAAYGSAVADDPWLDAYPVLLADVLPLPSREQWQLADADSPAAAPLLGPTSARWRLTAISGGRPVPVFAEAGPSGLRPLAAWLPTRGAPSVPLPLADG